MATILVVDDSPFDLRLMRADLERDPDLHVLEAANGAQALQAVESAPPDLVVTDLMMPEMDGLALVAALREKHPLVPVILTTGQGDEETAARALREGAVSYVPKRRMARDLLATVQRVLAVSIRERRHFRLMGCLTRSDHSFVLENDSALFSPLISYLQADLTRMGLCEEADRTRVAVALQEALTNALCHGNLGLDPWLREQDGLAYCAQLQARCHLPPYSDRRIHVDATLTRDKAVFTIRDEGEGFDPTALPNPTDPENIERSVGRGILLMRTFMDEVAFSGVGNAVTLVKYRGPQAP